MNPPNTDQYCAALPRIRAYCTDPPSPANSVVSEMLRPLVGRRRLSSELYASVSPTIELVRLPIASHRKRPASSGSQVLMPSPSGRSEEHTSEIPSLMRISYAGFCLKKNTDNEITRGS